MKLKGKAKRKRMKRVENVGMKKVVDICLAAEPN